MRCYSSASSILALVATGVLSTSAAYAQQVTTGATITISQSSANVLNLLGPYLGLNATSIGQSTLTSNLSQAIATNNNATAALQALAVSDKNLFGGLTNTITLANGSTATYGVASNLAGGLPAQASVSPAPGSTTTNSTTPIQAVGGLGSVLGPIFQQGVTPTTVAGVTTVTGGLAQTAALLNTAYGSFTSKDLGVAKNYFANGAANNSPTYAADQKTVTAATINPAAAPAGFTLPTANGLPNMTNSVYDLAYGVTKTQAGQDVFGSSRPTQVSAQINNFDATSLNQIAGNPSFPSGHTTYAYTDSILIGMLVPQLYQSMLSRGSEYGNSRIVLGVHYPLDIIASRSFVQYDLAQAFTNAAYQNGTATTASNTSGNSGNFNLLNQFTAARTELTTFLQTNCGNTVATCATSAANTANDPYVPSAANLATYTANLTYGLPTLTFAQAPQEAAPAGGPDASVLLAPIYGGTTAAAQAIAPTGGINGSLSTATINQIIVNTENNALAAFYGTPLSYWSRINLYAAAGYFGNVTGTLSLATTDSVTVPVTIGAAGVLDANGTVSGTVAISSTGTLTGSGTVGAVTAAAGSTVAPGSLAAQAALQSGATGVTGTQLAVNGAVGFAPTSTFAVSASSTQVTSLAATGGATLNGAAVTVTLPTTGTYVTTTNNRILVATGGVTGTFGSVTSNLLFATPTLSYDANDAFLSFGGPNFRAAATTRNQLSVATALTNGAALNPGSPIVTSLALFTKAQAAQGSAVLGGLSGSGLTAAQNVAQRSSAQFTSSIFDQTVFFGGNPGSVNSITLTDESAARAQGFAPIRELADLPATHAPVVPPIERPRTYRVWATGFGGAENINGNAGVGSGSQNNSIVGGTAGIDYQVLPGALLGVAAGGTSGSFNVPTFATSGTSTGGHVAGYGFASFGRIYAASSLAGSFYTNRTTRTVAGFGGVAGETESGNFNSREIRFRIEGGQRFTGFGGAITPFLALEVANLRSDGFSEVNRNGPTVLGLNLLGQSTASVPTFIGARFERATALGNGLVLTPALQVAYVHEFAPQRRQTGSLAGLPQAAFLVDGARPAYNSAQVKAGAELSIGAQSTLFANFDGEFSGSAQFYGGKGGFKYAF